MFVFQLSYFIHEFKCDQSELTTRHAQPQLEPCIGYGLTVIPSSVAHIFGSSRYGTELI